jgi:hypothetical protein|tara:strand:+ start:825 stop:1019 length:195 start_codon:yes stop_codon:yes gene_type:complete
MIASRFRTITAFLRSERRSHRILKYALPVFAFLVAGSQSHDLLNGLIDLLSEVIHWLTLLRQAR